MKEKIREAIIRSLWNLGCMESLKESRDDMIMAMKAYHTQPAFHKICNETFNEIWQLIEGKDLRYIS